MDYYQYTSLTPDLSEIRLVTLAPGPFEADIECQLHHELLSSKPIYEALSYTWGDLDNVTEILLGQRRFKVTTNLEIALRYLRHEKEARTLWVDAICINQADLEERSQQVLLMREIYSVAATVLAWTGEASDDSDGAMAVVEQISKHFTETSADMPLVGWGPEELRQIGLNLTTKNWSVLSKFLQRPYWSRIWVVQEISCGKLFSEHVLVGCGSRWVPKCHFDNVCMLLLLLGRSSYRYICEDGSFQEPIQTIMANRKSPGLQMFLAHLGSDSDDDNEAKTLSALLHVTKGFQATDTRDNIYALLGLCKKDHMAFITDYTKPTDKVFKELVRFLINTDRNLESLIGNPISTSSLKPSWIPAPHVRLESGHVWSNEGRYFQAAGDRKSDVEVDDDDGLLFARGIIVGAIRDVVGPFVLPQGLLHLTSQPLTIESISKETGLDDAYKSLAKFSESLEEHRHECFWRTLVVDRDFTDFDNVVYPAPESFEKAYRVSFNLDQIPEDYEPELPSYNRFMRFVNPFTNNMDECLVNRCFFDTDCGRMGVGPFSTKPGDLVVILFGGDFCFVLRPKGDQYEFVGDAYLHGVMNGELVREDSEGNPPSTQIFCIC